MSRSNRRRHFTFIELVEILCLLYAPARACLSLSVAWVRYTERNSQIRASYLVFYYNFFRFLCFFFAFNVVACLNHF